jgi:N-methylhydantoinase B
MGPPSEREAALVARDVRDGLVSDAAAREFYRVAVLAEGTVDEFETRRLRGQKP